MYTLPRSQEPICHSPNIGVSLFAKWTITLCNRQFNKHTNLVIIGINANFVFPYIRGSLHYADNKMLVNVKLKMSVIKGIAFQGGSTLYWSLNFEYHSQNEVANIGIFVWWKNHKTRMHSSRMRTARSLTVSCHIIRMPPPGEKPYMPPWKNMHTPQKKPHMPMPPGKNHAHPPEKTTHAPLEKPCTPPEKFTTFTQGAPPASTANRTRVACLTALDAKRYTTGLIVLSHLLKMSRFWESLIDIQDKQTRY